MASEDSNPSVASEAGAGPQDVAEGQNQPRPLTLDERLDRIESMLWNNLPELLKKLDENISKREDAKMSKLMDDILNAVTSRQMPQLPSTANPSGRKDDFAWVGDIFNNPIIKQLLGAEEAPGIGDLAGLKRQWDNLFALRYRKILQGAIDKEMSALGIPKHEVKGEHE